MSGREVGDRRVRRSAWRRRTPTTTATDDVDLAVSQNRRGDAAVSQSRRETRAARSRSGTSFQPRWRRRADPDRVRRSHSGPVREIQAGSGYWSQNGAVQVFGFEAPPTAVWVRWPGGGETRTPVPAGAKEVVVTKK